VERLRGVMSTVHVAARQGARWVWEEEVDRSEEKKLESEEEKTINNNNQSRKRLGQIVEEFGWKSPYQQPSLVTEDPADLPCLKSAPSSEPQIQDSNLRNARKCFHTSRLFRDRVSESPFQDRVGECEHGEQKLSDYLSDGPGSGGSEEPLLAAGAVCSLPRIVVFSPSGAAGCNELAGAGQEMKTSPNNQTTLLTPLQKARSMEERSSSEKSQVKMKLKRNSSMSMMKTLVTDSIDEIVKVAEVTKPVMIMKAAIETVTFKREDNIKREMDEAAKAGKTIKEDLSLEHYNRLQDAFHHHDQDQKGFLTKPELRDCLRTLGHNPTEQEMWRFMAQVDVDHSGTLDFDEFFSLMSRMMSGWDPESDLGACWGVLDPAGSGKINLNDLVYLLKTYGAMVDDDEIEEMFGELIDFKEIDFNQFLEAVVGAR